MPGSRCGRTRRTSRPDSNQARLDREDLPTPAPALPVERGTPTRLQPRPGRSTHSPRPVDQLGPAMPDPRLRRPPTPDRETPDLDPRRDRAPTIERTDRVGQHQDPAHDP